MKKIVIFYFFVQIFIALTKKQNFIGLSNDDDVFYDENFLNKEFEFQRFKTEMNKHNGINEKSIVNLKNYLNLNEKKFKENKILKQNDGKCVFVSNFKQILKKSKESKFFKNLKKFEYNLNNKNHIFSDKNENLLIFSICSNLFDEKCKKKLFFVSKLDFAYFEFVLTGEKIPNLEGFTIDLIQLNDNLHSLVILGGIDASGQPSNYLYRILIDYNNGSARVTKVSARELPDTPFGMSEHSMNILQLTYNITKNDLVIVSGGFDDNQLLSDKLQVLRNKKWNTELRSPLLRRKGHSSVLIKEPKIDKENGNVSYRLAIFGGKNETDYLNDLVIIDIKYNYKVNEIKYEISSVDVKGNLPEGRENHRIVEKGGDLYLIGGCNQALKQCFDDIYLLELDNRILMWEKISERMFPNLNAPEISKLGQNFIKYDDFFINIGVNDNNYFRPELNIIIDNWTCKADCDTQLLANDDFTKSLQCYNETQASISNKTDLNSIESSLATNTTQSLQAAVVASQVPLRKLTQTPTTPTNSTASAAVNSYSFKSKKKRISEEHAIKSTISKVLSQNLKEILAENEKLKKQLMSLKFPYSRKISEDPNLSSFDEIQMIMLQEKTMKEKTESNLLNKLENQSKLIDNSYLLNKNIIQNVTDIKHELAYKSAALEREQRETKDMLQAILSKLGSLDVKTHQNIENLQQFFNKTIEKEKEKLKNEEHATKNNKMNINSNKLNNTLALRKTNAAAAVDVRCKVNSDCNNNGFCDQNSGLCICYQGFKGPNCATAVECSPICQNGGICSYAKCLCPPGFTGSDCSIIERCPNNCNNQGVCKFKRCFCNQGWTGKYCNEQLTCKNNCSNKGICFLGNCICEPGYTGDDCSLVDSKLNQCQENCNGHGVCRLGKCFCDIGFSGDFCERENQFLCPPIITFEGPNKPGNGTMVNSSLTTNVTSWKACNGNGICKYGRCFCFPGFHGQDCSGVSDCSANPCRPDAFCIDQKCHCAEGANRPSCYMSYLNGGDKVVGTGDKVQSNRLAIPNRSYNNHNNNFNNNNNHRPQNVNDKYRYMHFKEVETNDENENNETNSIFKADQNTSVIANIKTNTNTNTTEKAFTNSTTSTKLNTKEATAATNPLNLSVTTNLETTLKDYENLLSWLERNKLYLFIFFLTIILSLLILSVYVICLCTKVKPQPYQPIIPTQSILNNEHMALYN